MFCSLLIHVNAHPKQGVGYEAAALLSSNFEFELKAEHVERDLVLVSRQRCPVAAISLTHLAAACALFMYSTVVLYALVTLGWRRRTGRAAGVT